ncbi:MAG TPA: CRISPR-associated endonuclease Cas1 [Rudaea sp.]|nr:CRISPR-associated endonuclease Cas1 [Rudaea sp.]
MTRHIVVQEHGRFLGIHAGLLQVRDGETLVMEAPLSRLASLTVAKTGVGLSADLVLAMAARGARLFFVDFRGALVAALHGTEQHATVAVRRRQLAAVGSIATRDLARAFVIGKLRNQRALLRYFAKYHEKKDDSVLRAGALAIESLIVGAQAIALGEQNWRERLLGHEGEGAATYFRAIRAAGLAPPSFRTRIGRGAQEITNAALNLGYSMLSTRVWTCLANAGLECYAGVLHEDRPGKPSLVLDVMEEHRPFVVDRAVFTLRAMLGDAKSFDATVRRKVIEGVNAALDRRIAHRGRKLRVETVMQRQAYRLAGAFAGKTIYRPTRYAW